MTFRLDVSDVNRLAAQLHQKGIGISDEVRAIVEVGARNVKDDARKAISGLAHAPAYPFSIGYELFNARALGLVSADIGPDKDKPQGALGNILEYGTVNNAPFAHLGPALDREAPGFEKALADVAGEVFDR